jgi:hypothetical protein
MDIPKEMPPVYINGYNKNDETVGSINDDPASPRNEFESVRILGL